MATIIDKSNNKAVSSAETINGRVNIKYVDGHSESVTQDEAIARGVVKNPGTITTPGAPASKKTITPGQYTTGTGVVDPFGTGTSAQTNWTVPIAGKGQVPIGTLLNAANDPKALAGIRNGLVANGIISKGTKSANSVIQAYTSVLVKAAAVSMDPNEWMRQYKLAGGGLDSAAGSGPSTNISLRKYTPDTLRSTAESVYNNTIGRKISDVELQNITNLLNERERKTPTKTVSTPNGSTTTSTTSGGVDEQQFIKEQAMKLPEYQRMQNMNFASWLNQAMSGGQAGNLANG